MLIEAVFLCSSYCLARLYARGARCQNNVSLSGKTAIVTGAEKGLGKAIATELAQRGARVILASKDVGAALMTADQIKRTTLNDSIVVRQLNMASLASVRSFAKQVLVDSENVDVLINNEAIKFCPRCVTDENLELQFAVNFLSRVYLIKLLEWKLLQSGNGRVINVTTERFRKGHIDTIDMQAKTSYDPFRTYFQTQLCNIVVTKYLAKKWSDTNIMVVSADPGYVKEDVDAYSNFCWTNWWQKAILQLVAFLLFKSYRQAAQTIIYCATSDGIITGDYFANCQRKLFKEKYFPALGKKILNRMDFTQHMFSKNHQNK